jgi:hypothetical protein
VRRPALPRGPALLTAAAVGLLVVGLVIDLGFTRPRVDAVHHLLARRAELTAELAGLTAREWVAERMLLHMKGEACGDSVPSQDGGLAFLARRIEESGLRRLEIVAIISGREGNLDISRFSVRATGSFAAGLEFVRRLESDRRLVVLESIRMMPVAESEALEMGFDLLMVDLAAAAEVAS